MGRRKKHQARKPFQRRINSSGQFIQLYHDLLDSDCFKDLSDKQKTLYIYCVREAHGEAMADTARSTGTGEADERLFYMSRSDYIRNGLYRASGGHEFQRDMAALIAHGLVDCVHTGRHSRTRSLYRLSSRWNAWPAVELSDEVMTDYQRNLRAKGLI